jgi:hypothetical protein
MNTGRRLIGWKMIKSSSMEVARLEEKCAELQEMLEARYIENEAVVAELRGHEISLLN